MGCYCLGGNHITATETESLREGIVVECTRAVSELLLAVNGLKGSLSIPVAGAPLGKEGVAMMMESEEGAGQDPPGKLTATEEEQLLRKQALHSMLTAPEYSYLTQPYTLMVLGLVSDREMPPSLSPSLFPYPSSFLSLSHT